MMKDGEREAIVDRVASYGYVMDVEARSVLDAAGFWELLEAAEEAERKLTSVHDEAWLSGADPTVRTLRAAIAKAKEPKQSESAGEQYRAPTYRAEPFEPFDPPASRVATVDEWLNLVLRNWWSREGMQRFHLQQALPRSLEAMKAEATAFVMRQVEEDRMTPPADVFWGPAQARVRSCIRAGGRVVVQVDLSPDGTVQVSAFLEPKEFVK